MPDHDITQALLDASAGDEAAAERLWRAVYEELRAMAHRHLLGERASHTLSATALVHEAYLKLVDNTRIEWKNRAQFYGIASTVMRRLLVDYARHRTAEKRGGDAVHVDLEGVHSASEIRVEEVVAVDDALQKLEQHNERLAQLVVLRYFGGLNVQETIDLMGISKSTYHRDWHRAKGWLLSAMGP
ncbi:MAG: ECF-type sigma factor [Bacteroidota bacterium]